MEARCLDAIWVSGVVQYNPQGCFIKFYGLGCWGWAVVGSDSWDFQKYAIYCTPFKTPFWHPQKSVWDDLNCVNFSQIWQVSLPKVGSNRVQNRTFIPGPRTFTKMSGILFRTPLIFLAPGRSFWKSTFRQGFPPRSTLPTWAPPAKNWVCRGAYIYVTKGPGYLNVFFCIGAKLLAGMADLIWSNISVPMHGYNPLFGREMAQIQPLTHTADSKPFLAQKCFIRCFLIPWNIKSQETMRFALGGCRMHSFWTARVKSI